MSPTGLWPGFPERCWCRASVAFRRRASAAAAARAAAADRIIIARSVPPPPPGVARTPVQKPAPPLPRQPPCVHWRLTRNVPGRHPVVQRAGAACVPLAIRRVKSEDFTGRARTGHDRASPLRGGGAGDPAVISTHGCLPPRLIKQGGKVERRESAKGGERERERERRANSSLACERRAIRNDARESRRSGELTD